MADTTGLEAVHQSLPNGTGDDWATVSAVADATQMHVTSVRRHLRRLAQDGRAECQSMAIEGRATPVWRQAATVISDAPVESPVEASAPAKVATAPVATAEPASDDVDAVAGWLESVRPVSPAPAGAENGNGRRGRKRGQSRAPRPPREPRQPRKDGAAPVARGTLGRQAIAYLRECPQGQDYSPTQVAKALGSAMGYAVSSGAVANALRRLASSGEARRTSEKPERYQAA